MTRGIHTRLAFSALALVAGCVTLSAQGTQTGTITGTVRNQAGEPIANATVTITVGQGQRTTRTDAKGTYRFSLLVPGPGKLTVSAQGYVGGSSDVRVNVDRSNNIEFVLKPYREAAAVVEVIAVSTKVDPTETKSGANITLEDIGALPINNRDILTIASLTPGTSADANGLTIRGSQATQVQYLVDGADVQDPVTGGPAVRLNEELLEEVQVISGAVSAEYGRFTGGVVNTVTKSGTNKFSGSMRFDVTNLNWNARNPKDPAEFPDSHNVIQNYMISGPIWKDHLFFVVGYRTTSPQTSVPGTTQSANWGGVPFVTTRAEDRKDFKLDWQIHQNHRVYYMWNKTETSRANIDYASRFGAPSTTLATLSSQVDEFSYNTLGYAGTLSNSLSLEARYNKKKQILGAPGSGGQGPKNAPMWFNMADGSYDAFDNGYFSDDGDSRPIENANITLSWYFDAMGSHEVKTGYQWFQSQRKSANAQTPSNYMIYFWGFQAGSTTPDWQNRILIPNDPNRTYLEWWEPIFGAVTKNTTDSFFVNDKWKMNDRWSFNLGVRFDKFGSKDDLGRDNFTFNEVSPRLAVMWDPKGDASQGVMFSYNVYVGNVVQGATDASSPAGNPVWRMYEYIGGPALLSDGSLNRAAFATNPFYVDDPFTQRTTSFDPNVKNPRTQELSLEYKRNTGNGTQWSVNLTKRKFDRFLDDFQEVNPGDGVRYTLIKNDPDLKRDYVGLEFQLNRRVNENLSYGVNATWSTLKGNIEGGQVGIYDARNNFGPNTTIPINNLSPYGYLSADIPVKMNVWAEYNRPIGKGHFNFSAMAYYNSGSPYSKTGAGAPSGAPAGYATSYTRFWGARGSLRFPDTYRADIQVAYSYPLWKTVQIYTRLNITNVFNHQLLQSWNTSASAATGSWVPSASYGLPTSSANYIAARTFNLAGGIRF